MLVGNWKDVLHHAWSVRLLALTILLQVIREVLPFLEGWLPVSQPVFALLIAVTTIGALASRFLRQRTLPDG